MSDSQRTTTLTLIVDTLGVIAAHLEHVEREIVDMAADLKTETEWSAITPELEELQVEIRASSESAPRSSAGALLLPFGNSASMAIVRYSRGWAAAPTVWPGRSARFPNPWRSLMSTTTGSCPRACGRDGPKIRYVGTRVSKIRRVSVRCRGSPRRLLRHERRVPPEARRSPWCTVSASPTIA